ncbi:hypothetical protein SLS53_001996 [Cytospora paraplurivora]|uniref:Uncharacterized protein n=1 Tax=Cytospora paraplurivora TaxID=2898453 RepID=A0AAN9YIZ8_9PEZI
MAQTHSGAGESTTDTTTDSLAVQEPKQVPTKKRDASSYQDEEDVPIKKHKRSSGSEEKVEADPVKEEDDDEEQDEDSETEGPGPRPRLTTPDLEFDYDRSKLKDPRLTPGRKARPRYDELDLPEELADRRPPSPAKPRGRLNALQKDQWFKQRTREDPTKTFHDLYRCFDKGPEGSPTYDSAGFQLDYQKVANWCKPKPYDKQAMINGMEKRVARTQSLEERIAEAFFEDLDEARNKILKGNTLPINLARDTISKDLEIPWHKIGHEEVDLWEEKGFSKHKVEDWLTYSDEDKKRYMKMLRGASLRK